MLEKLTLRLRQWRAQELTLREYSDKHTGMRLFWQSKWDEYVFYNCVYVCVFLFLAFTAFSACLRSFTLHIKESISLTILGQSPYILIVFYL